LVHGLPLETNLEALCLAIVSEASNASILDLMVLEWKRGPEVLTIDDPMPTAGAPMREGCPVVYFIGPGFVLAGFHQEILSPRSS
jgi:hypothetical protein